MSSNQFRSWIKSLSEKWMNGSRSRRYLSPAAARDQSTKVRPRLETLEDRVTPASLSMSAASLPQSATSLVILGTGLNSNPADDYIFFSTNSGSVSGTVTAASTTSLTVSLTGLTSVTAGTALDAYAINAGTDQNTGTYIEVAVVTSPGLSITPNTAPLFNTATSLTIAGFDFDPTSTNDSVTFDNSVTGSVTAATATSLIVSLTGLANVPNGTVLNASATVDGNSTGSPVPVATVEYPVFTVTDPNGAAGSGSATDVTLPWAVANAQNGFTILFASSLSGDTITLNSTLTVATNVTITGLGADELAVSGGGTNQVLSVTSGTTAIIADLTIQDGSIRGNGGGINNSGTLTLAGDAVSNNFAYYTGGGIYNTGTLTVYDSTVNGNEVLFNGGGIYNSGTLSVVNSTISANDYFTNGGGIDNVGALSLTNATITGNMSVPGYNAGYYGGGVFNQGNVTMVNTLIANNTSTRNSPDIDGTIASANNSLIDNGNGFSISTGIGNQIGVSPDLAGVLANNGGPTETVALQSNSPAILAGTAITTITGGQGGVGTSVGLTDTTIYVQNAAAIAVTPGDYLITVGTEEMLVTGIDTANNTLTVQRSYDGTTAGTYTAGTGVYLATDQRGVAAASPPDIGAYTLPILIVTDSSGGAGSATDVTLPYAVSQAPDIIEFAPSLSGATIALDSTLSISSNLEIIGLGANELTISGDGSFGDINVASGVTASISGVTIDGGSASGGGIKNSGTLTLANAAVSNNNAGYVQYADGGGIFNSGTLTIYDSTVNNNQAVSDGGGIYNTSSGTLSITNSTIYGNSYYTNGGGIYNAGSLNLSNSTVTGNTGVPGTSTYGFSYGFAGGGIFNTGAVTMSNTIVANNTATNGSQDISGTIGHAYNNVIDNGDGFSISAGSGNQVGVSAGLATSLADNGGTTQTVALQVGSPAIATGGAITFVTSPIGQNDTTIYVQNAAAIAATSGDFTITIDQEELLVTGVDLANNSLVVERGYNGTTPETHNDNAGIYLAADQSGNAAANPPDVGASTVTGLVVTDATDGPGSATDVTLRYAVANAVNFIEFAPSLSGTTITLTSTLTISHTEEIIGLGSDNLTISGGTSGMPVFSIAPGVTAGIDELTITNGVNASGGGIVNNGTLTLTGDLIVNNSAVLGGGIYNTGTLTLKNTIVAANAASGSGSGIYSDSAVALTISATTNTTIVNDIVTVGTGGLVLTGSGTIDIPGNINLGAQGSLTDTASGVDTINGQISGTATLTEAGSGTLILTQANSYTGATTINGGTLIATADGAMGPASDPGIFVNNGGALGLADGIDYTTAEPLTIEGAGPDGGGALVNISGDNTYPLPITLELSATIGSNAGTLTLGGAIDMGPNQLTFTGSGDVTVNGAISGYAGVTKTGTGTVTLAGNNSVGSTTVDDGTLIAASAGALGPITGAGAIVNTGGTLGVQGGIDIEQPITISGGTGAVGQPGTLVNISGDNSIGSIITPDISGSDQVEIGSDAGTLTINSDLNLPPSELTIAGAGNVTINGAITPTTGTLTAGITYVGTQFDLGSGWRTASVPKTYDPEGNDVLGNDGYFVVGNNQRVLQPSYFSSMTLTATNVFGGNSGYASIDDPTTTPGPNPTLITSGTTNPGGDNEAELTFTIGNNAPDIIQVGVMIDGLDIAGYNPSAVWLAEIGGSGASSAVVATTSAEYNDRDPDWLFFDIVDAAPGSTYAVYGDAGQNGTLTLQAFSFDSYSNNVSVVKEGTGTATLSGANTYTGGTDVNAGVLVVTNDAALSTGGVKVSSVGTLGLQGGVDVEQAITLANGAGAAGEPGTLVNISGNNSLGSSITPVFEGSGPIVIGSALGTLTINSNFSLPQTELEINGAGNVIINGAITPQSAPDVTYVGTQFDLGSGWRTASVPKTYDPEGNNILGNDGYYVVGNNQRVLQPSYFSSMTLTANSVYGGNSNYASIDDPSTTPGSNPTTITSGTTNGGYSGEELLNFVIGANAPALIQVGVMIDGLDSTQYNNSGVYISEIGGSGATSGVIATTSAEYNDQDPDWLFFDIIDATPGLSFGVYANAGASGQVTLQAFAFDSSETAPPNPNISIVNVEKEGTGTLTLNGANTYTGGTTINAGVVVATSATSLGAGSVTVASGGTLGLQGGIDIEQAITLDNGAGAAGQPGTLANLSGDNSIGGTITPGLTGSAPIEIGSTAGTLTINSNYDSQQSDLVVNGAGNVTFNGAISSTIVTPPTALSYVGTQFDLGSGWRTASVPKTYDPEGNNILGNDGYYVVGNNQRVLQPSYLSSMTLTANDVYGGNSNYASIDDPSTTPGSSPTTLVSGTTAGGFSGEELLDFVIGSNAPDLIQVGVMIDGLDDTYYNNSGVYITEIGGSGLTSGVIATTSAEYNDRDPDWLFFDITNATAGMEFGIYANAGASGQVTLQAFAFDSAPATAPSSVSLEQDGTGTLTLASTNTYTGATQVNSGTLEVDGSIAASSGVTVATGATLTGVGTTAPLTVAGGTVSAGNPLSPTGTLSVNSANFSTNGNLTATIANSATSLLSVTNSLTLGGTSTLTLDLAGLTSAPSGPITIATDGSETGAFAGLYVFNNPNDFQVAVGYTATAVTVTITSTAHPTAIIEADTGTNPSGLGANATFTVTVTSASPISGETVSIEDASNGDAVVATPTLTNGTATFSISSLSVGSHNLFAVYTTDGTYGTSYSNVVTQVVVPAPPGLAVTSVTATPSGFVLLFNEPIDPKSLVLYSSPGDTTLGAADISIVGATTGTLRGSVIIDPTNPDELTFVQTSGLLAPDTYTVGVTTKVTSDGTGMSSNYSTTFSVASTSTPVLSVPSFARGPGQTVALTDTVGNDTGIPVNISNATGVTQVSFSLTYDPQLLTIAGSGALSLSSAASLAGLVIQSYTITPVDANHSILTVSISGGTGFTATIATSLVTILASVPTTAPYLDKEVLNLSSVQVNGASATGVSSVAVVAYPGDVLGTGLPNATDASLVDQVASGSGTGFSVFKDLDPAIIGGVGGGLLLNANDASLIDEAASGATVAQIPSIPVGVSLTFGGPDPYLYLSAVQGAPGQTVTETLYLDVTDPNGIQLTALDEAIGFDVGALQISDVRGTSALAGLGSYDTASTVDNGSGEFLVAQAFMGTGLPPVIPYGTDIPVLEFNVTLNADMSVGSESGLTLLQYGTVNNVTQYTAISDNEGALSWTPGKAPSNSGNTAIDGSVMAIASPAPAVVETAETSQASSVAVTSRAIEPVRRVIPPVSPTPVAHTGSVDVLSGGQVVTLIAIEAATPAVEIPAATMSSLPSSSMALVQPDTGVTVSVSASAGVTSEFVQITSVAPTTTRSLDSGAALSLAVQGVNKAASVAPTVTSNAKVSTSVLDELYRQLGSLMSAPSVTGYNLGLTGEDTSDELSTLWDLDGLLADNSEE